MNKIKELLKKIKQFFEPKIIHEISIFCKKDGEDEILRSLELIDNCIVVSVKEIEELKETKIYSTPRIESNPNGLITLAILSFSLGCMLYLLKIK